MLKFDWNFLFTIINLIILFLLMKRFLYKPIKKAVNKRREVLEKEYSDAENAKKDAEQLKSEYQQKLDEADEERNAILKEAQKKGRAEYNKILGRAQDDAKQVKDNATREASEMKSRVMRDSKREIADLAVNLATKVVGENADPGRDSEIIDAFLKENNSKDINDNESKD